MTQGQIEIAEKLLGLGTQTVVYGPEQINRTTLKLWSHSMGRDKLDLSCPKCLRGEMEFLAQSVRMAKKKAKASKKEHRFILRPIQFHLEGFGTMTPDTFTDDAALALLKKEGATALRKFAKYPDNWSELID